MKQNIKLRTWDFEIEEMTYMYNWEDICSWKKEMYEENSVMFSTGLKDKNDIEIYNGDIVKNRTIIKQFDKSLITTEVGEITIMNGMTYFLGTTTQEYEGEISTSSSKFLFLSPDIYEIIGNIYENPYLSEGVEDEY